MKQSGLDLGMATSAGRARTFAGQRKRLAKAGKRLQKLRSLKVPVTRKKVRVYSASIVAAGIWVTNPRHQPESAENTTNASRQHGASSEVGVCGHCAGPAGVQYQGPGSGNSCSALEDSQ